MKKFSILLVTILLIHTATAPSAAAQTGTAAQSEVVENSVEYIFGERIYFQAIAQTAAPVESAAIFFQAEQDARTNLGQVELEILEDNRTSLKYRHLIKDYAIRPFSQVEYRFEISLTNGEKIKSQPFTFAYLDNRFDWQIQEEPPFRVFWVDGDLAFAQSVLDTAQQGMLGLQKMLALPTPRQTDIYIYRDPNILLKALNPAGPSWVAGHADPDLQVILVAIPEGSEQRQNIEQRIPHELSHIVLYEATRQGYYNIPTFLIEGLASNAELYPNQDFQTLLDHAVEADNLLPLSTLCDSFPRDASSALLAYAQSASFTRYLYDRFGASSMQALIKNYADGMDCEHGINASLGFTLSQLESQWRREALAQNLALSGLINFLPWLLLLLLVLSAPLFLTLRRLRARFAGETSI